MILHPTLAVTPDAKILGLLDLKMYERFGERRAGCKNHLNIPIHEKESYRWVDACEQSGKRFDQGSVDVVRVGNK